MRVNPQTEVKKLLFPQTTEMWRNLEEILISFFLSKEKRRLMMKLEETLLQ